MWEITKDILADSHDYETRVGYKEQHSRISNVDHMLGFESELLPGEELPKIEFRTIDDDGNVMYEGWLHDDDECANQTAALKFAETDVGCTVIEVYRDGEWVQEIG